jgi:transcriptional regulator with XRE-family HTH domain
MSTTVGARIVERAKAHKGLNITQLADALGVSYETVRKWQSGETEPNRSRVVKIAELLDVSEQWVRFGDDPASDVTPIFTNFSLSDTNHQPGLVFAWDEVIRMFKTGIESALPDVFSVELTDDSLAGRARRGDVITLCRSKIETVEAGDGVLVKTSTEHYMLRIYKPKGDGTFIAEAMSPNYLPLHSDEDGLTLLAVVVGVPSCRWSAL